MRVEWLSEARNEYRQLLQYYKTEVGLPYARKFASKILTSVNQLEHLGSDNGYIDCGIGIPCPEQSAPGNYF